MKKYKLLISALLATLLGISALFLSSCQTQEDPYVFLDEVFEKNGDRENQLLSFFAFEPDEMILEMSGYDLPIDVHDLTIHTRQEGSLLLQTLSADSGRFQAEFWSTPETFILRSTALDQVYGKPRTTNFFPLGDLTSGMEALSVLTNPAQLTELQNELSALREEGKEIFKQHASASLKQTKDLVTVQFVLSGQDCQTLFNKLLDHIQANETLLEVLIPFVSLTSDEPAASIEDVRRTLDELGLKDLSAELADDASLKITITATAEKKFSGIDIELTASDEGEEPKTLTFTFRIGELGGFDLLLKIPGEPTFRLSHAVKEEENVLTGVFDLTAEGTTFSPVTWTYEKSNYVFSVIIQIPGSISIKIIGTLKLSENELVLWIKQVKTGICDLSGAATNYKRVDITFRVSYKKSSDSIPQPPAIYEDLSQLNTRERKIIIRELKGQIYYESLIDNLIPFFN